MQLGPFTYLNRPFILRNWTIDVEFNPECLDKIPLRVKFPGLSLGYWSTDSLSKLESVIGRPMYTDNFTAVMEHIFYASILVEADISHTLSILVELGTPMGIYSRP